MSDVSEQIDSIIWNAYGKIERVVRTSSSSKSDLEFRYDAMGNRICKIVKPRAGAGVLSQDNWTYTYYLRDASGNVIAVYDRDFEQQPSDATFTDELAVKEQHLYGSSRVGIRSVDEVVATTTYNYSSTASNGTLVGTYAGMNSVAASTTNWTHELKRKSYELSNHLGNVLVTVSDARTANNSGGTITTFNAVIESAQDYYAFGSSMVGRTVTGSYRYSFNGKETDAETDLQDYGVRIYSPELGRFLSVDPLAMRFSWNSPYVFAENDVVRSIDLEGCEKMIVTTEKHPADGKPGKVKIVIKCDYAVVNSGPGAVPGGLIDAQTFARLYAKGNRTLYLSQLPGPAQEAEQLTLGQYMNEKENQRRGLPASMDYYEVDVVYEYNIVTPKDENGNPIETAKGLATWVEQDPAGRGMISMPIDAAACKSGGITNADLQASPALMAALQFSTYANLAFKGAHGADVGAAGMNSGVNPSWTYNMIVLNPKYYNAATFSLPGSSLSSTEIIVHEAGHNAADAFLHNTGGYEYTQDGLQSNQGGDCYPTEENTIKIINDLKNRENADYVEPK